MSLRVTARMLSVGRAALDFSSLCNVGKVRLHLFNHCLFLFGNNLNPVLVFCYFAQKAPL